MNSVSQKEVTANQKPAVAASVDPLLWSYNYTKARLSIGGTTLYHLIQRGEIESVKLGRRRMIIGAIAIAYVERLRQQAS